MYSYWFSGLAAWLLIAVSADGHGMSKRHANHNLPRSWQTYTARDLDRGRHLQAVQLWEPIRIYVHTAELEQQVVDRSQLQYLRDDVLQAAVRWFSLTLSVRPVLGSLQFAQHCSLVWDDRKCASIADNYQVCGDATIPEAHFKDTEFCSGQWSNCKVSRGGAGIRNADFALYVTALDTSICRDGYALGHASLCHQDQMDRPVAGHLNFCKSRVLTQKDWSADVAVAMHEMLHSFAFSNQLFPFYRHDDGRPRTERDANGAPPFDNVFNTYKPDDGTVFWSSLPDGTSKHYVALPRVLRAAQQHFKCSALKGVPLEESGGDGTAFSHWDQRIAHTEIMTPHVGDYPRISSLTLALLEDTGWYKPDYTYAGAFNFGRGRGCKFIQEDCVKNGVPQFQETFCTASQIPGCGQGGQVTSACTSDRMGKALCDICVHDQALPAKFQYFSDPRIGGQNSAMAYCPVWRPYLMGNSGQLSFCHQKPDASGQLEQVYGESFSSASRCIASTATHDRYVPPDQPIGSCHEVACGIGSVHIRVGSRWVECPASEEGVHKKVGGSFRGHIVCPPWAEICGTRGDAGPRAGIAPCMFPAVQRRGRCVCGPGYINEDCSIPDTVENRNLYPFGLEYPQDDLVLTQGVALDRSAGIYSWPLRPRIRSGPSVLTYTVSPPLPDGLTLSGNDGTLTGTPRNPTSTALYVIRAAGGRGASTATLTIIVQCAPETPGCSTQAVPIRAPDLDTSTSRSSVIANATGDSSRHHDVSTTRPYLEPFDPSAETHDDEGADTSLTPWFMRMQLGGVRFQDIQRDPGIDMFRQEFATAISSAISVDMEVTLVYSLQADSIVVEFHVVGIRKNMPSAQAAEMLVRELDTPVSPLYLSEFGMLYLRSVELYLVEDGPAKIWPNAKPEPEEEGGISLTTGIEEWQTWVQYVVLLLFLASFCATCVTSKYRQNTRCMRFWSQFESFLVATAMMSMMVLLISEIQTVAHVPDGDLVIPEFDFNYLQSLLLGVSSALFTFSLSTASLAHKRQCCLVSAMACYMLAVAVLIAALMMSVWPQFEDQGMPWLEQLPDWQRRLLYVACAFYALSFCLGCIGSCCDDPQASLARPGDGNFGAEGPPRAKDSNGWSRSADVASLFANGLVVVVLVGHVWPELKTSQESGLDVSRLNFRAWLLLAMILLFLAFACMIILDTVRHCRRRPGIELHSITRAQHGASSVRSSQGERSRFLHPATSQQVRDSHQRMQERSSPPRPVVVGAPVDSQYPAPAPERASDENQAMTQMLAMGFEFDPALWALKRHKWDVTRAVESLSLNDPANRS